MIKVIIYSFIFLFFRNQSYSIPVFPGCEKANNLSYCFQDKLNEHIKANFIYPELALKEKMEGVVNVNFIISKNGSIINILTNGPHVILEKETRRIISLLPKMTPALYNGKKVNVPYSTSLTFKMPYN